MFGSSSSKNSIKHRLMATLVSIGQQENYENISITQVCTKAGIDRSSFYRYYSVKDDLLRDLENAYLVGIDHCSQDLLRLDFQNVVEARRQCYETILKIATFHMQTREVYLFLIAPENDPYFRPKLKKLIERYLIHTMRKNAIAVPYPETYLADFVTSGIVDVLQGWSTRIDMTPEEFAKIATDLSMLVFENYYQET